MCLDDCCDEFLCCLCAPLAAIFCCKLCKDKMNSNNVSQVPNSGFYQQTDGRVPATGIYGPQGYGPRIHNQADFYPGSSQLYYPPQRQAFQRDYFPPPRDPMRYDLSGVYVKHQPRPY